MSNSGVPCVMCDGQRSANLLMTWLANGATMALCDECQPPSLINVLAVSLGVDPTRFYDTIKRWVDKEAKRQAAEAEKDTTGNADPDGVLDEGESTYDPGDEVDDQGGMSEVYGRTVAEPDGVS